MLQNALWCQITWSKCMLCNILESDCSETLDIQNVHGQRVLQLILFLFITLQVWTQKCTVQKVSVDVNISYY